MRILIGLLLITSTTTCLAQSRMASPAPPQDAAPTPSDASWNWTGMGVKPLYELAHGPSSTGGEQLEFQFVNHEFLAISIRMPTPRKLKSTSKSTAILDARNQVDVTLTYDAAEPITETWVFRHDPYNEKPLLMPFDTQATVFKHARKSKQLTISYPGPDGKPVKAVFDTSAMAEQMKTHNEDVHHFSQKDAWRIGLLVLALPLSGPLRP